MKHRISLAPAAALAVLAMALAMPAAAQNAKAAAAADSNTAAKLPTVNGKAIPKSRYDFIMKQRTAQGQPDNDQVRKQIMDSLVNTELLVQEADKKGLSRNSDVQGQLDVSRQEVLARAAVEDYLKAHPVKEEQVRAEYDRLKAQQSGPVQEYRARHILVEKEDEAKSIIERLKKGEKFEDLAKLSKDPGSRDRGGDLDWAAPTNFVKPFSDAMVKLDKGKYTETPVQTQFGWHVIRLDDVRTTQPQVPDYDQVKQRIFEALQQRTIQAYVGDLRSKAKVE
jgi:peptidyl-prolyl cis-trans isomerase C